jgi:hypothetical protein
MREVRIFIEKLEVALAETACLHLICRFLGRPLPEL